VLEISSASKEQHTGAEQINKAIVNNILSLKEIAKEAVKYTVSLK